MAHSSRLFDGPGHLKQVVRFTYRRDESLEAALQELNLTALGKFEYDGLPLGKLITPSLQWILRRYHLIEDETTLFLCREYILSANNVAREFTSLLERVDPQAVVVFNGILFPEATARFVAQARGYRVITHEVGLGEYTAFFTDGEATAYPIGIPEEFQLTPEQDARLDAYLEKRFQGKFSMAGIRFWPEMRGLDEGFLQKARRFKQIVPVFTNVVFDTSQVHAGVVFPHMFAWLDVVLEIIRTHPETLFVIRAHPDEMRLNKESRQSVRDWVLSNGGMNLDNVIFIDSQEYLSSYALIQQSKFVLVYNSSIGLEAALMGAAVLCGGKARYTQYPIVFFPQTSQDFRQQAEAFLAVDRIEVPPEFQRNARRFLYYQLFRTSLPFKDYLEEHTRPGFVRLRSFPWQKLTPDQSPTMRVIMDGVLHETPFLLKD